MNFKITYLYFIAISILVIACSGGRKEQEKEKVVPYSEEKKKHRQELLDWNKDITQVDYVVIEKFIERRKWDMQTSETGLFWQIYFKTEAEKAEPNMIAVLKYTISLLDGSVVYTSDEFGLREIHLGHEIDEKGLSEGVLKMRKGEKARFIAPPYLAYGVPGDGYRIPYYSSLVYDVELVDLYFPEDEVVLEDGWY